MKKGESNAYFCFPADTGSRRGDIDKRYAFTTVNPSMQYDLLSILI